MTALTVAVGYNVFKKKKYVFSKKKNSFCFFLNANWLRGSADKVVLAVELQVDNY